jgi:hypothetical protein
MRQVVRLVRPARADPDEEGIKTPSTNTGFSSLSRARTLMKKGSKPMRLSFA